MAMCTHVLVSGGVYTYGWSAGPPPTLPTVPVFVSAGRDLRPVAACFSIEPLRRVAGRDRKEIWKNVEFSTKGYAGDGSACTTCM